MGAGVVPAPAGMRKPRLLVIATDDNTVSFFRLGGPYGRLRTRQSVMDIDFIYVDQVIGTAHKKLILESDAVLSCRPLAPEHLALFRLAKLYDIPLVIDFDDNQLDIPTSIPFAKLWGPETEGYQNIVRALEMADMLHLAVPELAQVYRGKPWAWFPNAIQIDHECWGPAYDRRGSLPADRVVVMWHGTPTHEDTAAWLNTIAAPALRARPQAMMAICSADPTWVDRLDIADDQKVWIAPHEIRRFHGVPSCGDIHLAPIVPSWFGSFADGKSELKCLQAGIWRRPTICSPTAPYRRFHEVSGGANVLVRQNRPSTWIKAIIDLIDDEAKRRELGERARAAVEHHYSLDLVNEQRVAWWADFFRALGFDVPDQASREVPAAV